MKRILNKFTRYSWLIICSSIFVSACTTTPPPASVPGEKIPWQKRAGTLAQIHNWNLNGKIGVQTSHDSGSASVQWRQNQNNYTLSLLGPLGSGGMTLRGQPGTVSLTTADGKRYHSDSAEDLLAKNWGYNVPVSYLTYWIRGLPAPQLPANSHFDQYNRLTSLQQGDWMVRYLGYSRTSMGDLPNQLAISSNRLRAKIIVYSWQVS